MSLQTINNGTFDNDPSAEKIRLAFQKVKEVLLEQYTTLPNLDPATLSGQNGKIITVNAGGTAFELVALAGGGDMLSSNNLSDVLDTSQARLNIGLGSAATKDFIDEDSFASDSATKVPSQQSVKAYVTSVIGTGYSAGTGIDITAGVITNTETDTTVTGVSFAPSTGILTITLTGGGTATVDLSAYTVLKVDGYQVKKGAGNTDYGSIEIGDFYWGWASTTRYVNGKCTALPYGTAGNTTYVIDNEL